ncbi:MAG TPA: malectin domain-containing carbohydrate-binding protein [Prolixibacteraceae bacterium]|nr:malectin domain-containing carbohydrate-binding protein [Prolixibacteraceae bacterium]
MKKILPYKLPEIIAIGLLLIPIVYSCKNIESESIRSCISLNEDWKSIASDLTQKDFPGFEEIDYDDWNWEPVTVPHNWDDYSGYRRLRHGNRHGTAWYRKTFEIENPDSAKSYFLLFEGVGSYATVWLNGDSVGYHAGGRTTFTLDVTKFVRFHEQNILAVKADHPENIRDLPWVCGGCSPEWGFCEGSQPMGIFRPVHLIATSPLRVKPFGIHVWNDTTISEKEAVIHFSAEIKNYGKTEEKALVVFNVKDSEGNRVASVNENFYLLPGNEIIIEKSLLVENPVLWSLENPYLYKIYAEIFKGEERVDSDVVEYGIRTLQWDIFGPKATNRFYLNGDPVFINGTAEYEHLFGQSHAFSNEQVKTRVEQFKAMGFNSFRDGHQPHNFRYHEVWDREGILWWPQMSAHIWFDTPEFRSNFKNLLTEWVKERRNSPSVILWGLMNESTLPEDFARECTELIRKLDPTTSSQRLVTTCNGGSGTDWNVVQNWSGTYGGNPDKYDEELSVQLLNGEYGAWRSIDLHTEGGFEQNGVLSEDRMNLLMESKIRLAEKVRDRVCGQYHWLMASHDNPGRVQGGEGLRDIDRIGPVNYKGAFTIWGEPTDLFYLFRSNYADKHKEPMVYIVSHTWPDRWTQPGIKDGIRIFTNCDEVELFNSLTGKSLGRQKRGPIGTHILFDPVDIQYNIIRAAAFVDGKKVAEDIVMLHHLPDDPELEKLKARYIPLAADKTNYLYRVNCGGDEYTDSGGNVWMADRRQTSPQTWGSVSWTDDYDDLPAFYGSQRYTSDPIEGTTDYPLLQTFRYGRHKLKYNFPAANGNYRVSLYFIEPWYGTGGGLNGEGWRIFDVAINNEVVADDLDIWSEVGHDKLLMKWFDVEVETGNIEISFPEIKSGQAVISAIAISTFDGNEQPAPQSLGIIAGITSQTGSWKARSWMTTGTDQYINAPGQFSELAPELYGADWLQTPEYADETDSILSFTLTCNSEVYIGIDTLMKEKPNWLDQWQALDKHMASTYKGKTVYRLYKKRFPAHSEVRLEKITGQPMYPVAVLPVTLLDDPIDLRNVTRWQAEDGKVRGTASVVNYLEKKCAKAIDQNGTIGAEFQVGLASKYGLHFRYINLSGTDLPVHAEIVANDGRLMWSGEWVFLPTPNEWKSFRTDTQTTINAGTYSIKLTPKGKGPLYIDWIEVQ